MADKLGMKTRYATAPAYEVGQYLPLEAIRTDGGTQARAGLNEATIQEYAEAWLQLSHEQNGFLKMPLIVVFHDGEAYWLADGFHRVEAYTRFVNGPSASASPRAIRAEIRSGTRRDAVLYACGANSTHGLKRTDADKRRACARVLKDDEWTQWSDSEIARRVNVDHKTVASVRAELVATGEIPGSPIRQSADGKARDVTGIRESNARRKVAPADQAPLPDMPAPAQPTDLPLEYAIIQRRYVAQGYQLLSNMQGQHRAFVTRKEGMTGVVTFEWQDVLSKLERLEGQAAAAPILTVHSSALWAVADASYSADRLSNGKMKKPFAYDGRLWIGVGGHYAGGLSGARVEDCVCVVAVGTAYTPGEPNKHYRTGSYCGNKAHYHGVEYELTGQWLIVHNDDASQAPDPAHVERLEEQIESGDRIPDAGMQTAGEIKPAYWYGSTCERFTNTAALAKWCAVRADQLTADARITMAEEANQLIVELETLIEALT